MYLKIGKKMADSEIRTRHFWLSNSGEALIFVLIKVLTALQESLRIMGSFRKSKKNADY